MRDSKVVSSLPERGAARKEDSTRMKCVGRPDRRRTFRTRTRTTRSRIIASNLLNRSCPEPTLLRQRMLSGAFGLMASLLLLACAPSVPFPASQSPRSLSTALDQTASSATVPGMAVLEVRNGRVVGEAVRGVREAGTKDQVRVGDAWHLGSNGKPITATLIARLVERGDLSWTDRLEDLLPEIASDMRSEFREATLLKLLSHRSGLAANSDAEFIEEFRADLRPLPEQRLAYLRRALSDAPAASRGAYNYSNTGFIAAGAAAERATGLTFEDLLRQEVFQPLGMRSAGFGPTPRGQPLGHVDGTALTPPRGDNPLMWAPAGSMHMSLEDWASFAIDQMKGHKGDGRLLSAQGYAFLHTPVGGEGPAIDWGVVNKQFGTLLIHTGSNSAWYAVTALAPGLLNAVVVATNAAEEAGGDTLSEQVFELITSQWDARGR
jgi:CubicO group peptidase (beta-lactamase class C family)